MSLYLKTFDVHSVKIALCQVWLKLAKLFRRSRILNFVNVIFLSRNYLPLQMDVTLHLNNLEFLSSKDGFRQMWLILAQWFWRRR